MKKQQKTSHQSSMKQFIAREKSTMAKRIAKILDLDGIAAKTVAKSDFFAWPLDSLHMQLPKDHKTVMENIHNFFQVAKNETIQLLKESGGDSKFSSKLDEWTSIANKRYLNVNILSATRSIWLSSELRRIAQPLCLKIVHSETQSLEMYSFSSILKKYTGTRPGPGFSL